MTSRSQFHKAMPAAARTDLPAIEHAQEAMRLPRVMAYLDAHGATFEACVKHPGWYQARWKDEAISDEPRRWACCVDPDVDGEHHYARSFRARCEAKESTQ